MQTARRWLAALIACTLCAGAPAAARDLSNGTYNLLVENDIFGGTDRHYTSGLQLSYLSARGDLSGWLDSIAHRLPGIHAETNLRAGYMFGQSIFTPSDNGARTAPSDERPYAGWLYGGLAVVAESDHHLDTWLLHVGVVGPSALGEEAQQLMHDWIGSSESRGWDAQLRDEPGLELVAERRWPRRWQLGLDGYALDLTPHVGLSLGNVATYANLGLTLRLGTALDCDAGPPRIRPSLPGSAYFAPNGREFRWYAFLGVDGRPVAHNIFLDGNTFRDSASVDKKPVVADLQAGLAVTVDGWRLAYTYVYRTREFDAQDVPDRFGALSVSAKF
ncbi:MAG: lipid A deacylase LpxR family protein [Gammaproteobacteria bacterium]